MTLNEQNMATMSASTSTMDMSPSRPADRPSLSSVQVPDASTSTTNALLNTEGYALSKRPAVSALVSDTSTPDASIPSNGIGQANIEAKPMHLMPDRTIPSVSSGDEAIDFAKTSPFAPRRKSPAKAGGIGRLDFEAPKNNVDANSSGQSQGSGAHGLSDDHGLRSPIAENSGEPGRDDASSTAITDRPMRRHELISTGHNAEATPMAIAGAGDDRAHHARVTHAEAGPVIAEITQLVRMRRRWHKAEKSLTLQGKALCRSWTAGDKDEANAAYDRAAAGNPDDPVLAMALAPFLDAKARFEGEREAIEKTLRKLAKSLPVWKAWAEGVKGLGDLRLAVIVGECGDIGSYRNPSCLWKRMGLAVIGDQRQRRVSDAADALEHGYNPERRAIAYVMGTELLKAQVRNVKDDEGKRTDASTAIGAYGQLYLDRKVYEAGREGITKAHANNRAARYMVKRVLRDLYAAWRAAA